VSNMNISRWNTPFHGLEAAFNLHNVALGLAVFFLSRVLAILYFINNINEAEIIRRARKQLLMNVIPFLVFFLTFVIVLLFRAGFAYDEITKTVFMKEYKYFYNFMDQPITLSMFLIGVGMVLSGIYTTFFKNSVKGIWPVGLGTILTVMSLFFLAGFTNTCYYPSTFHLQSSLTIENSSSSHYTLTAMSYVSLFVPIVVSYIFYAWRAINNKQISADEINSEHHSY
jgi:cytochrome d ubiquinol oxidase subunit II